MKYFANWKSRENLIADFFYSYGKDAVAPPDFPTDDQIIFAAYGTPSYEGYAFVVYEQDGQLFEVNASHCSCFGLEDQWAPEDTSWKALAARKLSVYDDFGADTIARWEELKEQHKDD